MRTIQDEFTDLPVSKQRKWQLRKRRSGQCVVCGKKSVTKTHCEVHAQKDRERVYANYIARIIGEQ